MWLMCLLMEPTGDGRAATGNAMGLLWSRKEQEGGWLSWDTFDHCEDASSAALSPEKKKRFGKRSRSFRTAPSSLNQTLAPTPGSDPCTRNALLADTHLLPKDPQGGGQEGCQSVLGQ